MFGLSLSHLLIFALIVILLFGTSKLKNIGSDLGGAVKGFKDSVKDSAKENESKIETKKDDEPKAG